MKTKLYLLLICFATTTMLSCSKEGNNGSNSGNQSSNELIGTKWVTSYADDYMVIEFVSENQVQGYFAKGDNYAYWLGLSTGSYSLNGKNITFSGFDIVYSYVLNSHYKPQTGTYSGSIMQTQGLESIYSDNDWTPWNETWSKH